MPRLPSASSGCRHLRISLLSGLGLLWAWLAVSQAASTSAITADGTLGTTVTPSGTTYTITGGTRPGNGPNLFHSFDRFNVGTGDIALFSVPTGTTGIANILSRVTGGQRSEIDGRLSTAAIPGANLFLLNPSGVIFGPNAILPTTGSFHVSTADFLRFTDGAKFFANLGQESRLTVAEPAAFGFLGNDPASITTQGSRVAVNTGRALSVVAGDITLAGSILQAASGRIHLASVASPGEVIFSPPLELAPDLQVDAFARLGRIALLEGTEVRVRSPTDVPVSSRPGAGTVLIRGGRLLVDNAAVNANTTGAGDGARLGIDVRLTEDFVLTNGGELIADSQGAGRAGDVQVTAGGSAAILGQIEDDRSRLISRARDRGDAGRIAISAPTLTMDEGLIRTSTEGDGRAGNLEVRVGRLTLTGGAQIDSNTAGAGPGGTVHVTATDSIVISGHRRGGTRLSGLGSTTEGHGEAGHMVIATPTLSLEEGLIAAYTRDTGRAGDIVLEVGRLTLTGGAIIDSGTFGAGPGGTVHVTATDSIVISGRASEAPYNPSALSSNVYDEAHGHAGRIVIATPTLSLEDGGAITSGTLGEGRGGNIVVRSGRVVLTGGAAITGSSCCAGPGGTVTITATDSVVISGHLSSDTLGHGPGGNLRVAAPHIQLSNGGTIAASSSGDGAAGSILLQAGEMFRSDRGRVTTAADRAGGGTVALTAGRLVQLIDSELSTSVRGGGGDAGNLTLTAPSVIAEGSRVIAQAFEGMGGRINITAEVFLADPASLVDASSALGISGTVDIRAPMTSLSETLAPLPQAFVNVAALLPARCAARFSGGKVSSLVLGGRDGLPLEPGGVLPSPLTLEARLAADPAVIGAPHQQTSAAKFALLASQEKALPRFGCPK